VPITRSPAAKPVAGELPAEYEPPARLGAARLPDRGFARVDADRTDFDQQVTIA
jgi:hypothetical protein